MKEKKERAKGKEKKKMLLAAENPNRVTALFLRLGISVIVKAPSTRTIFSVFSSLEDRMYGQRPLAYAPTPYSYTPNPSLKASVNLDEVLCSGDGRCWQAG